MICSNLSSENSLLDIVLLTSLTIILVLHFPSMKVGVPARSLYPLREFLTEAVANRQEPANANSALQCRSRGFDSP